MTRVRNCIATKPHLYPACCVCCGAVELSGRYFVDLGFDIDHMYDAMPDGAVYMCEICLRNYVREFMDIIEEQDRTLEDVSFGRPRTDPVFDGYRETLDRIEQRTEQDGSDSVPEQDILSASFGG